MFNYIIQTSIVACACISVFSINAYAVKKEDPLRPPEYRLEKTNAGKSKTAKPRWYVNEILFSGERRVALVNGAVVIKGDRVNGARVIDIKPAYVVLEYKDKIIKARLKAVSVKNKVRKK